jgi:hypothetical protein
MTSQRWSRVVSVLVFGLVLVTAGSARAQWGFPGASVPASVSSFGVGYGTDAAYGISPFNYGSFPAAGFAGTSNFIGFPAPGYARSIGRRPITTTSFESVSDAVTLVPSWNGSSHRVHRPRLAQPSIPRAAVRR